MQLRIILTGASGFVGEGVLLACLEHPEVKEVLMVNRRSVDIVHPRLKELIVPNFMNLSMFQAAMTGYNACFYCAGISSVGTNEADYTRITYDTTLNVAETLLTLNPGIIFNFVSGSHTDSTETGRVMWARIKGKTENALMRLPFKGEYNFRPGAMAAFSGQKNAKRGYKLVIKLISLFAPKRVLTLQEIAWAMINATQKGAPKNVLEISDIRELATL
ncbi:epimerase [Spirosoma daeguense]